MEDALRRAEVEEKVGVDVLIRDLVTDRNEIVRLRHDLEKAHGKRPRKTETAIVSSEEKFATLINQIRTVARDEIHRLQDALEKAYEEQPPRNKDSTRSISEKTQKADDTDPFLLYEGSDSELSMDPEDEMYGAPAVEDNDYEPQALDDFLDEFVSEYIKSNRHKVPMHKPSLDRFDIMEIGKEKWDSMSQSEKDPYIKAVKAYLNSLYEDMRENSLIRTK